MANATLSEYQKNLITEMGLMDFETGRTENDWNELYNLLSEDDDFEDVLPEATDYYFELLEMGPAGFYEEFCNDLDFSDEFKAEYGGFCEDEDPEGLDDLDESSNDEQTKTKLKEDKKKNCLGMILVHQKQIELKKNIYLTKAKAII